MTTEFVPYVGEGQSETRDILNAVRREIHLANEALAKNHPREAVMRMTNARNIALQFIADVAPANIHVAKRLAMLCLSFDAPATEPYTARRLAALQPEVADA